MSKVEVPSSPVLWGIDFGSKSAGTTVVAALRAGAVELVSSRKGGDADVFLQELFVQQQPTHIGIDAPLSLPGVYSSLPDFNDYFYRKGDRELQAMSPMFLGGLTARAMRLTATFRSAGVQVVEVYPAAVVKECALDVVHYKNEREAFLRSLFGHFETLVRNIQLPAGEAVRTWHACDAILALLSVIREHSSLARRIGDPVEGVIVV